MSGVDIFLLTNERLCLSPLSPTGATMFFDDPALQALKKGFDAEKVKKEGIVRGTDRGFGFLEVANDKNSYFIAPQFMKTVVTGDKVSAVITEDREKGKFQAQPETLIESALSNKFVARVTYANGKLQVIPDNPALKQQTFNADDQRQVKNGKLNDGDWVMCSLKKHALVDGIFRAAIAEEITTNNDPTTPWTVSLCALDLPTQPPASSDNYPFLEESLPRADLTSLPFVTIDSEKTEDMDDALYIETVGEGENQGYKLYVAIADPTGYIDENSSLDAEAAERAFSIYLPGRNIPMLPRELSDNLCSLRENEVRAALVGVIYIKPDGDIDLDATTYKLATIKSQGKLIYNYVSDFIENGDTSNFNPSDEVKQVLDNLVAMTKLRDQYRSTVLASFRPRPDYEFVLTEDGALDHIEINVRRIANQIVEESMIAANVACGDFLAKNLNTGIFNTHNGFDPEEIDDAVELLNANGYKCTAEELETIPGFCAARRYANTLPKSYLDNMMRKYQEYSQMTISPGPHFALGVDNYATWTSPIRKYGDMINHRLIKAVICEQEHPRMPNEETLLVMNTARRTNRMAERSVREWLYADYLSPEVEKKTVFTGEVFDVVRGGLRVCVVENGAFIFIPMSFFSTSRDDVEFDMDSGRVFYKGEKVLELGDTFKVRLVSVDKINRSIVGAPVELPVAIPLPNVEELMAKRAQQQSRR